MRDSMRMRRNFESLSLRLVSRCLRTATAFLTRCQRSSGIWGARPRKIKTRRLTTIKGSRRIWGRRTVGLQDTEDLVTGNETDLGDTVRVTEGNTDLGGGETLASQLGDVVDDILGGGLEPRRWGARVWDGARRDTLSVAVKATHFGGVDGR